MSFSNTKRKFISITRNIVGQFRGGEKTKDLRIHSRSECQQQDFSGAWERETVNLAILFYNGWE